MDNYKNNSVYKSYIESIEFFKAKGYEVECKNWFESPTKKRNDEILCKINVPCKDKVWLYLKLGNSSRSQYASLEIEPKYAENVDTSVFDRVQERRDSALTHLKLFFTDFKEVEEAFSSILLNIENVTIGNWDAYMPNPISLLKRIEKLHNNISVENHKSDGSEAIYDNYVYVFEKERTDSKDDIIEINPFNRVPGKYRIWMLNDLLEDSERIEKQQKTRSSIIKEFEKPIHFLNYINKKVDQYLKEHCKHLFNEIDFGKIIDYIDCYCEKKYMSPDRAGEKAPEMLLWKKAGTEAREEFIKFANLIVKDITELKALKCTGWLKGDGQSVNPYFWVEFKSPKYINYPHSISLSYGKRIEDDEKEENIFSLRIEAKDIECSDEDFIRHNRIAKLPLPSNDYYYHGVKDGISKKYDNQEEILQHFSEGKIKKVRIVKRLEKPYTKERTNEIVSMAQDAIRTLLPYYDYIFENDKTESGCEKYMKNTILYGPPGTGKTYNTVCYAVAICEGKKIEDVIAEAKNDYSSVKARYDKLKNNGRIEFTTFHQSYGYEEFIEGIRPVMNDSEENKTVEYEISNGIFKAFCDKASEPISSEERGDIGLNNSPTVWKVSLEGTGSNPTRSECMEKGHIRIGYDSYGENITDETDFTVDGGERVLNAFINKMRIGDIVLSCFSSTTIDAIGVITGDYEWHNEYDNYKRLRNVNWIVKGIREDISAANGSNMTLPSAYKLNISVSDVLGIIKKYSHNDSVGTKNEDSYVFIIDEINRGNISKIFGELITLIEPSKRLGQPEELRSILPYSKKPFGVPDNVYIIGTMNTADRSIAAIDTALRRRFSFKEMLPDASIFNGVEINDGKYNTVIDIEKMLNSMNAKICALYDREHTIGHAYFIDLLKEENRNIKTLGRIFKNNIIPLLQEYFYEDYEKIRLVLGDNRKQIGQPLFFVPIRNSSLEMFQTDLDIDIPNRYEINEEAFEFAESYRYI